MDGVDQKIGSSSKVIRRPRCSLLLGGRWVSRVSISPLSASTTISSKTSPSFSSLSFTNSTSSTAFHSAKVTNLRFVQSDAKCLNPWHLKHLYRPLGKGLGVGCWGRPCCGVWHFCGVGEMDVVGLGVEDELPLFRVWSCGEGFRFSYLGSCLFFFCYSPL